MGLNVSLITGVAYNHQRERAIGLNSYTRIDNLKTVWHGMDVIRISSRKHVSASDTRLADVGIVGD